MHTYVHTYIHAANPRNHALHSTPAIPKTDLLHLHFKKILHYIFLEKENCHFLGI